jgi:hypothetical protein
MPLTIDITAETFVVTKLAREQYEFQSAEDRQAGRARKPKLDRDTGLQLWTVELFITGVGRSVPVQIVGEPAGLVLGQPVAVTGLTVNHWQMQRGSNTREGVTYRAERIEPFTVRKTA